MRTYTQDEIASVGGLVLIVIGKIHDRSGEISIADVSDICPDNIDRFADEVVKFLFDSNYVLVREADND